MLLVFGPRSTDYDFGPDHPLTPRRFGPGIDLLRSVGAVPGLSPDASKAKHFAEARAALGLSQPAPGPGGPILPLRVDGQFFVTDAGPTFISAISDFLLFEKFCLGQDITSLIVDRAGFDEHRVLLTYRGGLGDFDGRQYRHVLRDFCTLLAAHGRRVELTCWADTLRIEPDSAKQLDWVHDVYDLVGDLPNVSIEGVNEDGVHDNAAPGLRVPAPIPGHCSHGSAREAGNETPDYNWGTAQPVWAVACSHPPRDSEWCRKVGHNTSEVAAKYGVPARANEIARPDQYGFAVSEAFDAGAGAKLFICSATFHGADCRDSKLMNPQEKACADAWRAGVEAVPIQFRTGEYANAPSSRAPIEHRDEWSIATHSKIIGDTAVSIVSKRNAKWKPVSKGNWKVVNIVESVVFSER